MTWEIAVGLFALVTFVVTIVKTVVPLTNAITRLTDKFEGLDEKVEEIETSKSAEHKELWDYNHKQDKTLLEHAMRLHDLDGKGGVQ